MRTCSTKLHLSVGLDFFRTGQSELTFMTNGTMRILVGIADDTEDEPDETFSIALVNPVSGATVIVSPDTITITIVDNDEPPTGIVGVLFTLSSFRGHPMS